MPLATARTFPRAATAKSSVVETVLRAIFVTCRFVQRVAEAADSSQRIISSLSDEEVVSFVQSLR